MSEIRCPKCNAEHDGSMDPNGWATCKSCVHLWNLKGELEKAASGVRKPEPKPEPVASATPVVKQELKDPTPKKQLSGYFPDETAPAQTAALTKREQPISDAEMGLEPAAETKGPEEIPVAAPKAPTPKVLPAAEEPDKETGNTVNERKSGFPDMRTRISEDREDGEISCPVCGASFMGDANGGETHCPHCDTTFNVSTGRYKVSTQKDDDPSGAHGQSYVGQVIGGCKIGQKLGEGGMGSVYHAKQLSLDRDVALKILPPELTSQQNFMKRFQQEARSLARINHSNIIGIYEFGEDKETKLHYMMMEFVDGEDLADLLRRRHHLTEIETLDILKQSSLGLEQAALKGIIHRDIKPDNIMMTEGGVCKVSDFGLAKNVASDSTMTNASIRVGTPAFMSPEQCDGLRLDFRSDVYSLGVTAYVMLTGHLPYNGESPFAIMLKHKTEAVPSVRDSMAHVNPAVDAFVQRMMQKEPEKRFSSWRVLREELDLVIEQITGKTQVFPNDAVPSSDMPTEVTNLNEDADPDEDVSAMLKELGQLERGDGGHPPLRSQSKEFAVDNPVPDESGAMPTVGDPLAGIEDAIPDSPEPVAPSVPLDLQLVEPGTPPVEAAPDLQLTEPGGSPPPQSPSNPLPAMPASPPPIPPGSGAYESPVQTQNPPPGSGAYQSPTQGSSPLPVQDSSQSAGLSAATGPTQRSSNSSPLKAEDTEAVSGSGKKTSGIRKRIEEAKTEQQNRITVMRSKAEQLFAAGKYKKAILMWQQASQATTDVSTREACFEKIQMARMLMKQRMKRRAAMSALLLIPILWAATFFVTPVAHNMYIDQQLNEITNMPNQEMKSHRMKELAAYAEPFAWYQTVCLGMSYTLDRADELQKFIDTAKKDEERQKQQEIKVNPDLEIAVQDFRKAAKDPKTTWSVVVQHAKKLPVSKLKPDDQEFIKKTREEAEKHLKSIQSSLEIIEEKMRLGRFREAEQLGKDLKMKEPRGHDMIAGLPTVLPLSIVDDAGQKVQEPTVMVNGLRLRDISHIYSLDNQAVHIEIRHSDYQNYVGEIPMEHTQAFKVVMQPGALWTYDTKLDKVAWVDMQEWVNGKLLINSPAQLMMIDANVGIKLSTLKRKHINIAPGLGKSQWSNALTVAHNQLIIGSGDGLLLNVGMTDENEFRLNQAIYKGNHSVLGSVEFDLLFRGGQSRVLLVRQGGSSVTVVGLVEGKEEWRVPGLNGAINPGIFFRNERLYVIDDRRFREFEEDGTKKDALQLPRPRTGSVVWVDDKSLVFPHAKGIDLIRFENERFIVSAVHNDEFPLVGGLVSEGNLIYAAFEDGSIRAFQFKGKSLDEVWTKKLRQGSAPQSAPRVSDGLLCIGDQKGVAYCFNARRGQLLRELSIATPVRHAPIIVGDKIICIDESGLLSAFKAPSSD